ncbi:unnamed protein product [Parnassius apollo]|uniref:(apollo) hypothetical protein n=1 Tax=Parnassius apollo TaxID=110799 RepID=A0A8S3W0T7_PARAO|nr:unnamed protein product [Parnassius apollo]
MQLVMTTTFFSYLCPVAERRPVASVSRVFLQLAEDTARSDTVEVHDGSAWHGKEVYREGTFLWTKRGVKHPLLLLNGFTYSYQKKNANGRISWYCSRRLKGCRASAISFGTRAFAYKPHDHPPPRLPENSEDIIKPLQNSYSFFGMHTNSIGERKTSALDVQEPDVHIQGDVTFRRTMALLSTHENWMQGIHKISR